MALSLCLAPSPNHLWLRYVRNCVGSVALSTPDSRASQGRLGAAASRGSQAQRGRGRGGSAASGPPSSLSGRMKLSCRCFAVNACCMMVCYFPDGNIFYTVNKHSFAN